MPSPLHKVIDMKLYWKVKVNGKWTFRKAEFVRPPTGWDLVHEVLPYRGDR